MSEQIVSKPDYGTDLILDSKAHDRLQIYLDDITRLMNAFLLGPQLPLTVYTLVEDVLAADILPGPDQAIEGIIFVTNNKVKDDVPAYWNGSQWNYFSDDTLVTAPGVPP